MSYDEQKLLRFKETILEDADEKIAHMNNNILKYEQRELNNVKQKQLDEIFTYMQNRVKHLKSEFKYKLTQKNLEFKKEVISFRNELMEKVMKQARERILNFINSNEYENYLMTKLKKVLDEFDFKNVKIKVRHEDLKFEKKLLEFECISEVIEDSNNKLGGFIIIDTQSNLMVDKTISEILNNKHQYFLKTSGLVIKND